MEEVTQQRRRKREFAEEVWRLAEEEEEEDYPHAQKIWLVLDKTSLLPTPRRPSTRPSSSRSGLVGWRDASSSVTRRFTALG